MNFNGNQLKMHFFKEKNNLKRA